MMNNQGYKDVGYIETKKKTVRKKVKSAYLIDNILMRVQQGFMTRETASRIILMIRSGLVFSKEGLDILQKAMK